MLFEVWETEKEFFSSVEEFGRLLSPVNNDWLNVIVKV